MKELLKRLIKLLGEDVVVVGKQSELDSLVAQKVPQGIWLAWEVLLTKRMVDEEIRTVHQTKKVFPGASIYAA